MMIRRVTIPVFVSILAFGFSTGCGVSPPIPKGGRTPIKGWEWVTFPKLGIEAHLPKISPKHSNRYYGSIFPYPRDAELIVIGLHPWDAWHAGGIRYTFRVAITRQSYEEWDRYARQIFNDPRYPEEFSGADDVYFTRIQEGYKTSPNLRKGDPRKVYLLERGYRVKNGDVIVARGTFDVFPGYNEQYFGENREMILRIIKSIKLIE